jgi:hypothetical protein
MEETVDDRFHQLTGFPSDDHGDGKADDSVLIEEPREVAHLELSGNGGYQVRSLGFRHQ